MVSEENRFSVSGTQIRMLSPLSLLNAGLLQESPQFLKLSIDFHLNFYQKMEIQKATAKY
jgi:hypothetical protein